MYKSNLSWVTLMEILDSLEKEGLIKCEIIGKRKRYRITKKGLNVLEYFKKVEQLLAFTP